MAMSEAAKKQFIEQIKLRVFDDQYIDREEEKELLQEAIKLDIGVDKGIAIISAVAHEKGFVIERDAEDRAKEILQQFAENDGVIDKKEFEDAASLFKRATKGKITDQEIKQRLKKIILDADWKVKEGGLFGSKWFSAI